MAGRTQATGAAQGPAAAGQTVDLTDLFGAAGRRVAEQLREAATWRERFALLDKLLL